MKTPFQLARLLLPAALSVATAAAATLVSAPPSALSGDLNAGNRFPFDPSVGGDRLDGWSAAADSLRRPVVSKQPLSPALRTAL